MVSLAQRPYRQILSRYQQGRGHHALLLHSQPGNGEASLCYALSRWLMCRQPDGSKSCGVCHSCRLMMAGNHPDFYQPEPEKGRQTLGVDSIRAIIDSVYGRARQGGKWSGCPTPSNSPSRRPTHC
ncbi:hypothetical protein SODG_002624 [Sodalis praecaptivus]